MLDSEGGVLVVVSISTTPEAIANYPTMFVGIRAMDSLFRPGSFDSRTRPRRAKSALKTRIRTPQRQTISASASILCSETSPQFQSPACALPRPCSKSLNLQRGRLHIDARMPTKLLQHLEQSINTGNAPVGYRNPSIESCHARRASSYAVARQLGQLPQEKGSSDAVKELWGPVK